MKNAAKSKSQKVVWIMCIVSLLIGIGLFWNSNKATTAYAATTPYNNASNTNAVRIDGWEEIRDMTIYGHNNDNGCGYTAMGILLQYYNDNSRYAGEILPVDLDYGSSTTGQQTRANALRGYDTPVRSDDLNRLTPSGLGVVDTVISWFSSARIDNATISKKQSKASMTIFMTTAIA